MEQKMPRFREKLLLAILGAAVVGFIGFFTAYFIFIQKGKPLLIEVRKNPSAFFETATTRIGIFSVTFTNKSRISNREFCVRFRFAGTDRAKLVNIQDKKYEPIIRGYKWLDTEARNNEAVLYCKYLNQAQFFTATFQTDSVWDYLDVLVEGEGVIGKEVKPGEEALEISSWISILAVIPVMLISVVLFLRLLRRVLRKRALVRMWTREPANKARDLEGVQENEKSLE